MRIAVLMGGPSSEHEVSLRGGAHVVDALDPKRFEVKPVLVTKEGRWRTATKAPVPKNGRGFDPQSPDLSWRDHDGPWSAIEELADWKADVVLPVFGLIGIGYGVAGLRLLSEEGGDALADFVFAVAIPLLIFRTLATADFSGASPWLIWLPFFAVFAVNWVIGDVLIRRHFRRDARAGLVAGISSAYGNTVLVGIPLNLAAYGREGAVPMAFIIAVHMPVMMIASAVPWVELVRTGGCE